MSEHSELCPPVVPAVEPLECPLVELIEEEDLLEIDPESVVEAAELLLREGAPHDFDVIVIGAGPGGLACAVHLGQNGQRVALVEAGEIGGTSLNNGCIPTKTLLESISTLQSIEQASSFGITIEGQVSPNLKQMQARKRQVISRLKNQSRKLAEEAGVQILQGTASLEGDRTIQLINPRGEGQKLSAVHLVLATGGVPAKLSIEGADLPGVLTSDQILELEEIPRRLIVLGANAIGIECATIFSGLGTHVTLVEQEETILAGADTDIQREMEDSLERLGIKVHTNVSIQCITQAPEALRAVCHDSSNPIPLFLEAELILMTTGRRANIGNLGLDRAGIEVSQGVIKVEADYSTSATGVWAIGDCTHPIGWAHQAATEGLSVAETILGFEARNNISLVPTCYYTHPEIATIGMTLEAAQKRGIEAHTGKCAFAMNARANTSDENIGFAKLVVETGTGKLLGAQIIGPKATEIINEVALALCDGMTVQRLAGTTHGSPTFAEVVPAAARDAMRQLA